MEMPMAGEAQKRLAPLMGTWVGQEKLAPSPWDPQGGTAIGRVTNRPGLNGLMLIQDYEQDRGTGVNFQGHGVLRWDEVDDCYVFHWFDSMGLAPNEYRGQLEDDVLTLQTDLPLGGHARSTFILQQPGKYVFSLAVSQDAETWHTMLSGEYIRQ
jgi:Protein of unknown function (DUF1579)